MTALLAHASSDAPVRLGRYDVVGFIRRGGMGTVYDAVEREGGRRVALKTLTHLDPESLLRFKTEFRYAADLAHPNLVALYELCCVGDLWFYTMERVDGVDFITWVRGSNERGVDSAVHAVDSSSVPTSRDVGLAPGANAPQREGEPVAPPSIDRIRDALGQLVRGVQAVHDAGLLHLDLKPSNVLVDRRGRVVVLDFGLVRVRDTKPVMARVEPVSGPLLVAGTPDWMAPEQFDSAEIAEPADWYAVGLMLYLALTGVRAYPSMALMATWYARAHSAPTSPANLVEGLPDDLATLAVSLLDPIPLARPTADAILEALALTQRDPSSVEQRLDAPAIVGRQAESAILRGALDRAAAGESLLVHLAGASGVGKTALLDALAVDAKTNDATIVLRGRCYERESVPYKAFDGMFDELAEWFLEHPDDRALSALPGFMAELSSVFPVLSRVPAISELDVQRGIDTASVREIRRRAVLALCELVETITLEHPLVLAIDDLQWADVDSIALLIGLLEGRCAKRLMIALTFQRADASHAPALAPYFAFVSELAERSHARAIRIDVEALAPEDARRLAHAAIRGNDAMTPELASSIARESGGSPFFVLELSRFAFERRADVNARELYDGLTLENVLARRVRALPPPEHALVQVLAVASAPIPLAVAFVVARIDTGALRAVWSLRRAHVVTSTGVSGADSIELLHDRMRQAVLSDTSIERIAELHLALGRALALADEAEGTDTWLFEVARHLVAAETLLGGEERARTAEIELAAGRRARSAAAFALAFECFHTGTRTLGPDAFATDYALALALHAGAAESAYLIAAWDELARHVAVLKANARTVLDQLPGWEAEIDGHVARLEYDAAVGVAIEALGRLDVVLPEHPTAAEIGAEVEAAMTSLAGVGRAGLLALPNLADPVAAAAMRLLNRISSAAYFARPLLFPVLACRQIVTSVRGGLSAETAYALSVYGIVLNTLGMHGEAHAWGQVALTLLDRFDDRSLEARTRHVVHDLVCVWTVPLGSTLDDLRRVVDIGRMQGDIEYAAYAAHAYVHNAFYACRDLEALLPFAEESAEFMRHHEQGNALHVHDPFVRLLHCFTGRAEDASRLDGNGFDEARAVAEAEAIGSRSAQLIVRLGMGIARSHFGSTSEASAILEAARPFLDGVASTWHVPMFHQYAALAIHALPRAERFERLARADADLAALRVLAESGPENFAHRVSLLEAARALGEGELDAADVHARAAIEAAEAGAWWSDVALACTLAARIASKRGSPEAARAHEVAARQAASRWGMAQRA